MIRRLPRWIARGLTLWVGLSILYRLEEDILASLRQIGLHMATQADIDNLVTRLGDVSSTVNTGVANIRADIKQLKSDHPKLDLSQLEASVAGLESSAGQVTALDGENPLPTPDEPLEPPTDPQTGEPIGQQL